MARADTLHRPRLITQGVARPTTKRGGFASRPLRSPPALVGECATRLFNPDAVSLAGAQGLTQVIPRYHAEKLLPGESLRDPRVSFRVGAAVLKEYLQKSQGNLGAALLRYSGSATRYPAKVLDMERKFFELAAMPASDCRQPEPAKRPARPA